MKRLISTLILIQAAIVVFAQSWTNYSERSYDHAIHYDTTRTTLVEIGRSGIHPHELSLRTAVAIGGDRVFYLYSETTNQLDFFSVIHLGTDSASAMATLRELHARLALPDGTRDTIRNDGYKCFLLVREDPKYGKLLVTRRVNDGGTVTINGDMFRMLESALEGYDEESVSCFPHRALDDEEAVKAEISRYKALSEFVIPVNDAQICYSPAFHALFVKRVKEYGKDLRALKRR